MSLDLRYAEQRAAYRTTLWRHVRRSREVMARPTARWRASPDYLIVGAQRAGTTSLHRYLTQSPAVVPPRFAKGIHWFDVNDRRSLAWYRSHFPTRRRLDTAAGKTGGHAVTGEASPYYLFHPAVPGRIAHHLPEVRVMVVLRDPVQRAWSHYHHEVARGFEDLSFEEAIAAEPDRLLGEEERLLREPGYRSFSHQHHGYLARGRYAQQLARFFEVIDRERILVLDSAELRADPQDACGRVAAFLGIPPWALQGAVGHNARQYERLPDPLREQLAEHFADADAALESLLGRRFSWMRP